MSTHFANKSGSSVAVINLSLLRHNSVRLMLVCDHWTCITLFTNSYGTENINEWVWKWVYGVFMMLSALHLTHFIGSSFIWSGFSLVPYHCYQLKNRHYFGLTGDTNAACHLPANWQISQINSLCPGVHLIVFFCGTQFPPQIQRFPPSSSWRLEIH